MHAHLSMTGRPARFDRIRQDPPSAAATAPELSGHGGAYLENCHIAEQVPDDSAIRGGIRQFACDPVVAEKLWAVSEIMVGEKFA